MPCQTMYVEQSVEQSAAEIKEYNNTWQFKKH